MGVTDFEPSMHHKVQSGHRYFNICENETIDQVSPKVKCTWGDAGMPRFSKTYRKRMRDLEGSGSGSPIPNLKEKINKKFSLTQTMTKRSRGKRTANISPK